MNQPPYIYSVSVNINVIELINCFRSERNMGRKFAIRERDQNSYACWLVNQFETSFN